MSKNPFAEISFFQTASTKAKEKESSTILLIDGSTELAEHIITGLPNYKISRVVDGITGLQKVFDLVPDLVIINASIPIMNGYECCKKIKEDVRTSSIPVILLMGKLMSDACIKALASEADDYLIAPFSRGELGLRVKKNLTSKHRLQKKFDQELNTQVATDKKTIAPVGQVCIDPFLKNVYAIIGEKFDDSTFGVKELATRVCTSKVSLYRKLKLLTGLAPANLITEYRLQRAALYLREGFNSSETAFRTGFNSAAYFTKCFRDFYKLTPLEFSRQKP